MAWLWWMFVLGSGGIGVIIGVIRIIAITLLRYREKVQFVKRFRHDIRQHAYAGLSIRNYQHWTWDHLFSSI